jgi:hypothetical protein
MAVPFRVVTVSKLNHAMPLMPTEIIPGGDQSIDKEDRLKDFFARHGGESRSARRAEEDHEHRCGWYEVSAADGYLLRCDWSITGETGAHMRFSELRPRLA